MRTVVLPLNLCMNSQTMPTCPSTISPDLGARCGEFLGTDTTTLCKPILAVNDVDPTKCIVKGRTPHPAGFKDSAVCRCCFAKILFVCPCLMIVPIGAHWFGLRSRNALGQGRERSVVNVRTGRSLVRRSHFIGKHGMTRL